VVLVTVPSDDELPERLTGTAPTVHRQRMHNRWNARSTGLRSRSATQGKPLSETKITVIYDNPTDPDAFEAAYEAEQLEAARRIPGQIRFEASKVWPKEDGSPTPAYRSIDLYYPDYSSASEAVTTPEAGAFFEAMARLSTGGVRVLFSDIEVPQR
jgi:uncharacterized protein (TIGR02118 family)